jgi:hypothetical protein
MSNYSEDECSFDSYSSSEDEETTVDDTIRLLLEKRKAETTKAETTKAETTKAETTKAETTKAETSNSFTKPN